MPMNFEIVTDSSCNLVEDMIDEFGLHILPLTFMVDGEQYQSYLKGQHTDRIRRSCPRRGCSWNR